MVRSFQTFPSPFLRLRRELFHRIGGSYLHFGGSNFSHLKAIFYFFSVLGFFRWLDLVLYFARIFPAEALPNFSSRFGGTYIFFPTYYVLGGSVEVSILASILYLQFQDRVLSTTTTIWQFQTIQPPPHSYHLEHKFSRQLSNTISDTEF